MIKVLIADDHSILRQGVKQLFALTDDIVVADEAIDGDQVLARVEQGRYDILLLDMSMPGPCGVELISRVHKCRSKLPILVLTMHNEPQIARRALQAGASGYLTKDSDSEFLLEAVRRIAGGGRYIESTLAMHLALEAVDSAELDSELPLSEREQQLLSLLARGENLNDIALSLSLSRGTVATYKARLARKLHCKNSAELIRYAMESGLT